MTHPDNAPKPLNEWQAKWVNRVSQQAVRAALSGKVEFGPLGFLDRVRLCFNQHLMTFVQEAIHSACQESGYETQSYRPYDTRMGESAVSPYLPLQVRVIEQDGVPVQPAIREGAALYDSHRLRAVDVYPPEV